MKPPEYYFGPQLATRLAGRTAHDLNNLAAVLSGHLYLLRENAEPIEEGLGAIEKATEQLQVLTHSLLALSAVGRDAVAIFDPNAVARDVASELSSAGAAVDLALDPAVPAVPGRVEDVRRALNALLANGRDASGPGGTILVSTAAEEDGVAITVEDSGHGVPEDQRERVFEPLFSTRGSRGRGIGLTIATLVSAMHGGSCELDSRESGGTRAVLRLRPF